MKKEFLILLAASLSACGTQTKITGKGASDSTDAWTPATITYNGGDGSTETAPVYNSLDGTWAYQNTTCPSPYNGTIIYHKQDTSYSIVLSGNSMVVMDTTPNCGFSIVKQSSYLFNYDLTNSGIYIASTWTNYSSGCVAFTVASTKTSTPFVYRINGHGPDGTNTTVPSGTNLGIDTGVNCDGYGTTYMTNYKKQ